jgi:hypothetical protein
MACCVIAAFLIAQCVAMLRRWGVFWGLLPVPDDEIADTIFTRTAAVLQRPRVRASIAAALTFELALLGGWVYVEHGTHVAELADIGWAHLNGERVVYADMCGVHGENRVRLALAPASDSPDRFF